jgi:hypothetical protein
MDTHTHTHTHTHSMFFSGYEVVAGTMTVGQFVMIQAYIMQLAGPLAWLVLLFFFTCACMLGGRASRAVRHKPLRA